VIYTEKLLPQLYMRALFVFVHRWFIHPAITGGRATDRVRNITGILTHTGATTTSNMFFEKVNQVDTHHDPVSRKRPDQETNFACRNFIFVPDLWVPDWNGVGIFRFQSTLPEL